MGPIAHRWQDMRPPHTHTHTKQIAKSAGALQEAKAKSSMPYQLLPKTPTDVPIEGAFVLFAVDLWIKVLIIILLARSRVAWFPREMAL